MSKLIKHWKWIILLLLIVSLSIMAKPSDIHKYFIAIKQITSGQIIVLILLQILSQLLVYLQWHKICHKLNCPIGFSKISYLNLRGTLAEAITPGSKIGGEAYRVWLLKKEAYCNTNQAISIMLVQKILSMTAFITISIMSITYVTSSFVHLEQTYMLFVIYGLLSTILVSMLACLLIPKKIKRILLLVSKSRKTASYANLGARHNFLKYNHVKLSLIWQHLKKTTHNKLDNQLIMSVNNNENNITILNDEAPNQSNCNELMVKDCSKGLISRLDNLLGCMALFNTDWKMTTVHLLLSFSIWLLYPVKLIYLIYIIDYEIAIIPLIAINFTAYLAAMLPIFPGGSGGFELIMASLLSYTGISLINSTAIATVFRFITFWFVILVSLTISSLVKIIPILKNREILFHSHNRN